MSPYTAVSWSDLRQRLQARWEGKPFWEDAEALLAVNEALRFYNLLTGRWHRRETLLFTVGQPLYTCSSSMLYHTRVTWNNQPLSPSSLPDLDNARPNWRLETILSGGDVPTRPIVWAPVSLRTFYLWPADNDAPQNNTVTIDGIANTPTLTADSDTIDLGEELLSVLLGYALHVAAFKKGGPFFESTLPFFKAFLSAAAEENDQIKTSTIYRRVMGLDRRDLRPLRGTPTDLDTLAGRSA